VFDPLSLLAIFGPLLVDGGKAAIQKYMAPDEFKPTKIEDYLSMRQNDLEMFKAMNEAGGTNPTYPWVEATVRMMRPAIALAVISTWASLHLQGVDTAPVDSFAAAIGFYLFGDRTLFYARKAGKL
jgi:hypothetical protein